MLSTETKELSVLLCKIQIYFTLRGMQASQHIDIFIKNISSFLIERIKKSTKNLSYVNYCRCNRRMQSSRTFSCQLLEIMNGLDQTQVTNSSLFNKITILRCFYTLPLVSLRHYVFPSAFSFSLGGSQKQCSSSLIANS